MSALGDELKRQREARLFSMSHLASLVGCNHSTISRIEGGDSTTVEMLTALSGKLGTDAASRWDAFNVLLAAWLFDQGVGQTSVELIELQAILGYLPPQKRSEVKTALNLLREHAEMVLETTRMSDDGCPHHEE